MRGIRFLLGWQSTIGRKAVRASDGRRASDHAGNSGVVRPFLRIRRRARPTTTTCGTRELLLSAFPAARKIAGGEREQLTRHWVHQQVREVHILRNRVAHHESLINGYPVPGTGGEDSHPVRRTPRDGADACVRLAKMIDEDLAQFIADNSEVDRVLDVDPRPGRGFV
jgi:hypothetical protein